MPFFLLLPNAVKDLACRKDPDVDVGNNNVVKMAQFLILQIIWYQNKVVVLDYSKCNENGNLQDCLYKEAQSFHVEL